MIADRLKYDGIAQKKSVEKHEPVQFFIWSRRNKVELLSYESKTTGKQGQYDWTAEKNFNGYI